MYSSLLYVAESLDYVTLPKNVVHRLLSLILLRLLPVKVKDEICNPDVMSILLFFCLSVISHTP